MHVVTPRNLDKYLGVRRFRYGQAEEENHIGQVTGLAWTEVGGELLTIEAAVVPGKGKLHAHRPAGRSDAGVDPGGDDRGAQPRAHVLGIDADFYQKNDCIIHVPEGATPRMAPARASACARRWSRR